MHKTREQLEARDKEYFARRLQTSYETWLKETEQTKYLRKDDVRMVYVPADKFPTGSVLESETKDRKVWKLEVIEIGPNVHQNRARLTRLK